MQFELWGFVAILFSLVSGILVSFWLLEGYSNQMIENLRKLILGTICYSILTMLPFMFVFFLYNDNDNVEIFEIFGSIVIFVFPLLFLYRLRRFPPLRDFLQSTIIANPSLWKDVLFLILFAGTIYSLYFYGIILALIM